MDHIINPRGKFTTTWHLATLPTVEARVPMPRAEWMRARPRGSGWDGGTERAKWCRTRCSEHGGLNNRRSDDTLHSEIKQEDGDGHLR